MNWFLRSKYRLQRTYLITENHFASGEVSKILRNNSVVHDRLYVPHNCASYQNGSRERGVKICYNENIIL